MVRQLGNPSDSPAEDVEYFSSGKSYLVFLQHLCFNGVDSGRYDVVGVAAGFYYPSVNATYVKVDKASQSLP